MNKSIIRFILCRVLQFEGLFLLLPVIVSLFYKENTGLIFVIIMSRHLPLQQRDIIEPAVNSV